MPRIAGCHMYLAFIKEKPCIEEIEVNLVVVMVFVGDAGEGGKGHQSGEASPEKFVVRTLASNQVGYG